jgi:hypothetical protein
MHCPNCQSDRVYSSKSGNQRLSLLLRPLVVVGRCHRCSTLVYRSRLTNRMPAEPQSEPSKDQQQPHRNKPR